MHHPFLCKEESQVKKKIIIALLSGFASIVQAELVSDKNDIKVSHNNLEVLLERAPVVAQKKLLKNQQQLKGQLKQLYLKKVLAQMALQEGIDKQGMNAERLQAIRNNALYLLKLDALRKANKKDYSKYAKQLYMANQADYPVAARIDAAHILISTKTLSDAQALEKAGEIRLQLMQGAKFSEVALKESDDKSVKTNLGELGTFTLDKMVQPFSDAAFAMQSGEISEPVKTKYGYHIIKLNKKISAGVKSFDEVKQGIISKLEQKDWEMTRTEFFDRLIKENEMQIDELAVDEFIIKKLDELDSQQ